MGKEPPEPILCDAKRWTPGNFQEPCGRPAKWLVEMEGRPAVNICGRHLRSYKDEIKLGWRGTITLLGKE